MRADTRSPNPAAPAGRDRPIAVRKFERACHDVDDVIKSELSRVQITRSSLAMLWAGAVLSWTSFSPEPPVWICLAVSGST